ncbi:MAG TPA: DUF6152 family protein [Steroidobacteraceae bacterium]|jgi:hypothetical protein|nr:DUF6152 family protein [Steroidobacteraceae bacterium]
MKPIAIRTTTAALWLSVAIAALPMAAIAHHSYAMFDLSQTVTLQGTIRDFQWTNPHSWIWIDVPDAKGAPQQWGIEGMSPNYLARRGWSKHTLRPGDKVSVVIHPLKGVERGGSFLSVTLADGTVMRQSGAPPPASSAP